MTRSTGPLDDVLGRWLGKDVIRGSAPFDPRVAVRPLEGERQAKLVLEIANALDAIRVQSPTVGIGWNLDPATDGEILAYIPAGAGFERRVTHGGLYADRLLVEPPHVPYYPIGMVGYSLIDLLQEYLSDRPINPTVPPTPSATPEKEEHEPAIAELDALLDELDDGLDDLDQFKIDQKPVVFDALPTAAENLLRYAWTVARPISDGWLSIVSRGVLMSDNIKELRRDPEVRAEIDHWLPQDSAERDEAFSQLFTGAGLADYAHSPYVLTLPSTKTARDLIELANRYYVDIPYGGVLIDLDYSPPRRSIPSTGTELQRGTWFDELLVGLGPVTKHLDTHVVCELRASGVAANLRHWLQDDLNRLAFAEAQDVERLTAECTRTLNTIADATVRVVRESKSATFQSRLKQAGIWGASGLTVGFVGTMITGGDPAVAAAAAGIGFALSAAAGAAAASDVPSAVPAPVLLDLLAAQRRGQQRP